MAEMKRACEHVMILCEHFSNPLHILPTYAGTSKVPPRAISKTREKGGIAKSGK